MRGKINRDEARNEFTVYIDLAVVRKEMKGEKTHPAGEKEGSLSHVGGYMERILTDGEVKGRD